MSDQQRHVPHGTPLPRATPISFPESPPAPRQPQQAPAPARHAPHAPQSHAHPHAAPRSQPVPVPAGPHRQDDEPAIDLEPEPEPMPVDAATDDDSIALIDADGSTESQRRMKSIRAFGVQDQGHGQHQYSRKLNATGRGPVRVKTFHAKLSDQGLEYLDNAINDWIEAHPEVDVKFVTSTVGLFDGKFKDLALILNVWY